MNTKIEVSEHNYLITIQRNDVDLEFLTGFLKVLNEEVAGKNLHNMIPPTFYYDYPDGFDHLDEK